MLAANLNLNSRFTLLMPDYADDEISLSEIVTIVRRRWYFVFLPGLFAGVVAYVVLLFVPDTYTSEILLAPRSQEGQANLAKSSGLASLGAIAGLNIGNEINDNVLAALEIIESRKFVTDFVRKRDLAVELFALKAWDGKQNILDETIYDATDKEWVREVDPPRKSEPQDWEVYEEFSKLLAVKQDDNGFVTVSLVTKSPVLSQQWLSWLVADLNAQMREREQRELTSSINFLNEKLDEASLHDIREIFFNLIAEQTRKLMMTESHEDYIFEVLDPAYRPVEPSGPQRLLIVIAVVTLIWILAGITILSREFSAVGAAGETRLKDAIE